MWGIEFALGYKFTDTLSARFNYTWNNSEITGKASNLPYDFHKYDGLEGEPLVAMPEHLANLTVEWLPLESVSTFASLQYRGKEYYPNFGQGGELNKNEDTTLTTDIGFTWEMYKNLKLSGTVYNCSMTRAATVTPTTPIRTAAAVTGSSWPIPSRTHST